MPDTLIAARDAFSARRPERRVTLDGREWGVTESGRGPALMLIPGTLGRGDIFWRQIEALEDRAHVIALTYPATGGITDWTADLAALLDRMEIGEVSILGSSLGGYLVQHFASVHPDRVARLFPANTLSSVAGLNRRPPYSLDLDAAPAADLRAGFAGGLAAWGEAHPEQAELVGMLLQEVNGRIPEAELRNRIRALRDAPELPPSTLPAERIFTIESDDDPLIPPDMRAAVRARLSPGVAYRFRSGGHFPYVARPEDYTALLEQALGLGGAAWGEGPERAR